MDDPVTHRARPRRWLRRSTSAVVIAAVLPVAQSASAGTTSGDATAQAATVELVFTAPNIDFLGGTQLQGVGPSIGSQTSPGSFDIADSNSMGSSAVATSGTVSVDRTATGVGASAAVEGLQLTLLGETVVSATTLTSSVDCPAGEVVDMAEAQAIGLRLGDAAPVDLAAGQSATGSTAITDDGGRPTPLKSRPASSLTLPRRRQLA